MKRPILPLAATLAAAVAILSPSWSPPLTAQGPAQKPAQVFEEAVEVRLVEIEVAVTTRKGESVDGLSTEDFRLEVNGEARSLDTFAAPQGRIDVAETAVALGPDEPALPEVTPEPLFLAVYVDRSFMEEGDFDMVRDLLPAFLDESLGPQDQVLLATSGAELRVLVPFEPPGERLGQELDLLEGSGLGGKLASDSRLLMREMRRMTQIDAERRVREEIYLPLLSRIETFYRESLGSMVASSEQLARLVDTLMGLPGRQQILYIGGPIPSAEAARLFEVWRDTFERSVQDNDLMTASGPVQEVRRLATNVSARNRSFNAAAEVFGHLGDAAAGSGITFHTLGLENLRRSANAFASRADVAIGTHGLTAVSPDVSADGRATLEMDDGLRTLSGRTGGLHFQGRRKIDRFLGQVSRDMTDRYVLGFYAAPTDQSYKVKVELTDRQKRRKLNLRYRRNAEARAAAQELAQRTLSALVAGSPMANPLNADVTVNMADHRADESILTLSVSLPLAKVALLDEGDRHTGRLWIYAVGARLGGKPSPVVRAPVVLSLKPDQIPAQPEQRVEYQLQVTVPAGSDRLAVSVRDDFGPTESTVGLDLVPFDDPG